MKHLTILVPDGKHNLSSIIGSYKVFYKAEEHWQALGNAARFRIDLAGLSKEIELYNGLFKIQPNAKVQEIVKTDLIIIPALQGDFANAIEVNKELVNWISFQHHKGSSVASICTGAFLLAATGLLTGKYCSMHWKSAPCFQQMFPEVRVVADKIITAEKNIFTNGGGYSFLQLLLYLVEKYYDRSTAIYCAKLFQIDMDRNLQSPFSMFVGQKDHNDEEVKKAQLFIETNVLEKITVDRLASTFALSRRSFDRRFKNATGNTPLEYLHRVKIEAAKKSLESSRKTVNEIMYELGYNDIKGFRNIFKKIAGSSPIEYRNKFNKDYMQLPN